jgi:acetyl-CoA carboxylase biotin carboxylase subunit
MFNKVLVANRGEIAVRVQQTLKTLGIATVAVYSAPDSSAPHVSMADEAWALDGQTAEETYLDMEKIIAIAQRSGADAIHPGYGFLSENPRFARACEKAAITFIGPTPENMEALGDKISSKVLAQRAGAPVVPNSPPCSKIDAAVEEFVASWGFPLLVKAAAGGGGRGMRLVNELEELAPALESASREANAAFGDGRVFLERYIPRPRHVEIQVLADGFGNTVHLLERDCSIQRRYQKIIEETPSPALTAELRRKMGEAAVSVAKEAGYVNAGTVEFLLDGVTGDFYFLEMNTRLQVEHPITEEVLGLDLVKWQVRIASGEALSFGQEDVRGRGHAVECRIYAEDPYNNFVPSVGTLVKWLPPNGPGLRLDSGVVQGQEISTYYDPMLAKLTAWGPDRASSLNRMDLALSQFPVLGLVTNIPFLRQIIRSTRFQEGEYDTGFLAGDANVGRPGLPEETTNLARALAAWALDGASGQRPATPAGSRQAGLGADRNSPWLTAGKLRFP